ncbi:MAG: hypothetical protein H0V76_00145 [Blastocatellia bacterium]|nr:hypothetical protein [Blastocatellia bacterium]
MQELSSIPPDASAALYFLPGQYLFANFQEGISAIKAISSDQVARAFSGVHTDTGWLGRRVLRYREAADGNAIISYEPASVRNIYVALPGGNVQQLVIPLPSLILLGLGRDYYLWATSARSISARTRLAVAPLPNIGSGKICFGKNEVPETHPSTLPEVWKLIFATPFNGDHAGSRCQTEPGDVRNLLIKLAADKVTKFPALQLMTSSTTVEDAWETIVERRRYDSRFS